jgi:RNase P/RNase MRP subunit POP5
VVRAVRRRYLAFVAEPAISASELEARVLREVRACMSRELRDLVRPRVYPIRPGAAIVRVDPSTLAAITRALDGLRFGNSTLRTVRASGTLRAAKEALGVRAGHRRKRARVAPRRGRGA